MKDQIADHAKDWLTLLLAGLGISFAPHEWIGGMFLALAAPHKWVAMNQRFQNLGDLNHAHRP